MTQFIQDSNYIYQDEILFGIYNRAVDKFFDDAGERIVFHDLVEYIKNQIKWKKQCLYSHGLPILKEVCSKIEEDFDNSCEYIAPEAKCYRDVYFNVFE